MLAASWLVRASFIATIGDTHSLDVGFWEEALAARDEGRNPYETGQLNWPPAWLQIIVALDYIAGVTNVTFWAALRVYLVLIESALVVSLFLTLVWLGARRDAVRRALLVGIALNPVAILLVCQHGNSDVNVGLLVTLAVVALVGHWRSRDVVLWLSGCLLLGLGVLAKTVPLVLTPVLAPGARLASRVGKALGLCLLVGPAALGLSVIVALVPEAAFEHVVGYRSTRGFFGFSGLLFELTPLGADVTAATILVLIVTAAVVAFWRRQRGKPLPPNRRFVLGAAVFMSVAFALAIVLERFTSADVRSHYESLFTLGVLGLVVWLWLRLGAEEPPAPARLFLLVAGVLMLVVAFGPGYGPQYAYWFLPALVATYVLLDDAWRRLLLIGYVIAGVTYAFEYALLPDLGAAFDAVIGPSERTADVAAFLTPYRLTLVRLPLFAMYVVLIAEAIVRLADGSPPVRREGYESRNA